MQSVVRVTHQTEMSKLLLLLALLQTVSACPGTYQPVVGGRCVRFTDNQQGTPYNQQMLCRKEGGELVSIHSDLENDAIRTLLSRDAQIGLVCDQRERKFYWLDGSLFDYSNINATCDSSEIVVVMNYRTGLWETSTDSYFYSLCGWPEHNDVACNDYDHVKGTHSCVALRTNKLSWREAEKSCQREAAHLVSIHDAEANKFVTAKAKELGLPDGLHIGLETHVSVGNKSWTDGSNVTYTNFATGFPNDFFGFCTDLETSPNGGEWVTNNCDSSQLPFACSRNAYDIDHPISEPGCPTKPSYLTSGTIYSPSYPGPPNATACDYFLEVDEGKKVQLTFDDFDLNICCDKLELYEGVLGGKLIGTITGEPQPGQVVRTSSSHIMRLVLTTNDGRFVRGFRAHFEGV